MNDNFPRPNELTNETKKSMKVRIITSFVAVAIILPCIFLGSWYFFGLIFAVVGISTYEIIRCPKKKYHPIIYVIAYMVMYSLVYWVFIKSSYANNSIDWTKFLDLKTLQISIIAIAVSALLLFYLVVIDEKFTILDACYIFAMLLIVALSLQAVMFIRYMPVTVAKEYAYPISGEGSLKWQAIYDSSIFKYLTSSFLMIYVLIGSCFNDIGAYFIGVFFGKHKINPRISPKKTWEGLFGGIFISLIFSLSFALLMDFVLGYPIAPNLGIDKWYWALIISIIMPIVGDLGDFVFSAVKRFYNTKDFGNILPGHGGILDRIDSSLFVCLVVCIMLIFITNGWNFFI